ncbi:MAG: hypothetical protein CSA11_08940 [Chloroflexi bacterium]|nr:MAG: hypothetical protein CSA11_08940 [Chloroflexota bacterium]
MFKRMCWLVVTVWVSMLLLLGFDRVVGLVGRVPEETAVTAAPYAVIVNEWSQGHGGNQEWVELLVVQGPADLRGWDLGDNSPGDLIFSQDLFWQAVPTGTLLLIYNGSDPDEILPADDQNMDDCLVVIPHNHAQFFTDTSSWPAFANATATDNPYLRDEADNIIHNFSADPGSSLHPNAQQNAAYLGTTAVGVSEVANWQNDTADQATPGQGNGSSNAAWINQLCPNAAETADLAVSKLAPVQIEAGGILTYELQIQNVGMLTAEDVILTDSLPLGVTYLQDGSGYPVNQPHPGVLMWQMGQLSANDGHQFVLTTTVSHTVAGTLENVITATTSTTETNLSNNRDTALTIVQNSSETAVLLDAVLYNGRANNDDDEAVALRNVGAASVDLTHWRLNDKALPASLVVAPGETIWLTKNAAAFTRQFGFAPDGELVSWPRLSNTGGEVLLTNHEGQVVDVLVYENGDTSTAGWSGTAVFRLRGFGADGQILYRMRDQQTGFIMPDTHTAADWAQASADVINGRKLRYPGWDLDTYFFTAKMTETAVITVAIAPDNAYEAVVDQIDSAQHIIQGETLTFENAAIADALVRASQRGVSVTLLMEGGPAAGVTDQEHYLCQQLIDAGGVCAFMINDSAQNVFDRYDYLHAKFLLIDGQRVMIGSQNLSPNSMPSDDKQDGTWGRRGVILITDAAQVVAHVQSVFDHDYDDAHPDIILGVSHLPPLPPGFVPITVTGGTTYTVRYPEPAAFSGVFPFEIVQSPENSLRNVDGLLGLVAQADEGDVVLVQQLYERPFWGSNPVDDPNPRLEAYIDAARRGARVRILLDAYFNNAADAHSNTVTCAYVKAIAWQENLKLECALANPTGLGIHNKMVLVQIDGQGFVHVGSINGSESSSKANREVALQLQSNEAYDLLADVFDHDWPYCAYLPTVLHNVVGPANHILISEVQYNPPGEDAGEFVELVNPTPRRIDMSGFSLGDAVSQDNFEDVVRFPQGTVLPPRHTLVIATSAAAFYAEFNQFPDFEILETETAVPNLIDDPAWGDPATFFQLGNTGDEVILRDGQDQVIDVVTYGVGDYPGVTACPLVTTVGAVLERFPYWQDTNNCTLDFREWPFPNPGQLAEP